MELNVFFSSFVFPHTVYIALSILLMGIHRGVREVICNKHFKAKMPGVNNVAFSDVLDDLLEV